MSETTTPGPGFEGRKLHFIAIGGAGMSGLALVCQGLGAEVTGSDRSDSSYMSRLRAAGLDPRVGHDAAQVPDDAEVIVSTAIPETNPELQIARERGQRVLHRSEMLAELCRTGNLIAVAGAHGKTTTSGMAAHALRVAGADPTFLLGGELPGGGPDGLASNAGWGDAGVVVAEADESDGSFLRLDPDVALVTNIELDHHSHWGGEAELHAAFSSFAAKARATVAPAGDLARELGADLSFAIEGFPTSAPVPADADFVARAIAPTDRGNEFELDCPGEQIQVRLSVPGRHNVANATAALVALDAAGAGESLPALSDLAAALETFPGMARRQERKGEVPGSGATIYDDYAHHPTEVEAALSALRELPHRLLIAVFQPHLYSRTKALAGRFGRALAAADVIGVLDVYPAREEPVGELAGVSGLMVAREAAAAGGGRPVMWLDSIDGAVEVLAPRLLDGDLLVTIGAGDVHRVGELLLERGEG